MAISGKTKLLGVIGYPVEHSLSPAMHNAAIAQLGVDYCYLPFPIHPDKLGDAVAGFAAMGLVGFNITIPHKQAIIPFLDQVSETAQLVGAVNTVWRGEQGLVWDEYGCCGFFGTVEVVIAGLVWGGAGDFGVWWGC